MNARPENDGLSRGSTALTRPRALLFDWDSTLVDNWRSIETALNATLVAEIAEGVHALAIEAKAPGE